MKRRSNISIWAGFLVVLCAVLTYIPLFVRFPATRDFPWPTLLIFGIGLALMTRGLVRAYRDPQLYRGKIFGPILTGLGVLLFAVFAFSIFYVARQLPPSTGAPQVGQKAPDFTLPDQDGNPVTLSKLLESGGVVLIFYRGYW